MCLLFFAISMLEANLTFPKPIPLTLADMKADSQLKQWVDALQLEK